MILKILQLLHFYFCIPKKNNVDLHKKPTHKKVSLNIYICIALVMVGFFAILLFSAFSGVKFVESGYAYNGGL